MMLVQRKTQLDKHFIALGALLICTASTLATQKIFMKHWYYIFISGLISIGIGISIMIAKKLGRQMGLINVDKNRKKYTPLMKSFLKPKNLAGVRRT